MFPRRLALVLFAVCLSAAVAGAVPANLPPSLVAVRQQVIDISKANTLREDNIAAVRAQLTPLLIQLATWYAANRPANEVALTQQPWKSLWYDDPTIDGFSNASFGGVQLRLNRAAIYQVVENGYYFNISESTLTTRNGSVKFQTFLKGAYSVINPPSPANAGQTFVNVVNLRFVFNGVRFGPLADGLDLRQITRAANARLLPVLQVPGPIGITGKLWNLYIDDELRISAGFEDDKPNEIDLYILQRVTQTGPI